MFVVNIYVITAYYWVFIRIVGTHLQLPYSLFDRPIIILTAENKIVNTTNWISNTVLKNAPEKGSSDILTIG